MRKGKRKRARRERPRRGPRPAARRGRSGLPGEVLAERESRGQRPADKFQPFEVRRLRAAEITYIPTEGRSAHIGAAAYLAVLAYPRKKEWKKRDKFIRAAKAFLLKLWIQKGRVGTETERSRAVLEEYRKFTPRDFENVFRKAELRIVNWRIPARMIGAWFHFGACSRDGKVLFHASHKRRPRSEISKAAGAMSDILRKRKETPHSGFYPCHVLERIIRDSLPVLHLAMALPASHRSYAGGCFDAGLLILKPEWLEYSIRHAEFMRCVILPRIYPGYKPQNAVCLLPACPVPTR